MMDFCSEKTTNDFVCGKRRVKIVVEVCLDPLPGWGHEPEDFAVMIQRNLDESVPHYHPTVRVDGPEIDRSHVSCIICGVLYPCSDMITDEERDRFVCGVSENHKRR